MTGLTPEERELSIRNRRVMAPRMRWPEGAVEACEKLEREHPAFEVCWFGKHRSQNAVFDREAGFYAWRDGEQPGQMWGDVWHGREEWYGATPEELRAQLSTV